MTALWRIRVHVEVHPFPKKTEAKWLNVLDEGPLRQSEPDLILANGCVTSSVLPVDRNGPHSCSKSNPLSPGGKPLPCLKKALHNQPATNLIRDPAAELNSV